MIMGSACCVAARDGTLPNRTRVETSRRNVICSPSWSFRRDNQRRVAGEVDESPYQVSRGVNRNLSGEIKGLFDSERGNHSDGGSLEIVGTPSSLKSPVHEEMGANLMTMPSGRFLYLCLVIMFTICLVSHINSFRNVDFIYL